MNFHLDEQALENSEYCLEVLRTRSHVLEFFDQGLFGDVMRQRPHFGIEFTDG